MTQSNTRSPALGHLRLVPCLMLTLACVGMADAFYDSYAIYRGQLLWCPPPIDGCNIVANSPYARIADIPLGYLGLVYYLYMAGLAALLGFDPTSRSLRAGAIAYAAMGVAFSAYFMYVQVTFIHAFCIYCLISAILTVLLVAAAIRHALAVRVHAMTEQGANIMSIRGMAAHA